MASLAMAFLLVTCALALSDLDFPNLPQQFSMAQASGPNQRTSFWMDFTNKAFASCESDYSMPAENCGNDPKASGVFLKPNPDQGKSNIAFVLYTHWRCAEGSLPWDSFPPKLDVLQSVNLFLCLGWFYGGNDPPQSYYCQFQAPNNVTYLGEQITNGVPSIGWSYRVPTLQWAESFVYLSQKDFSWVNISVPGKGGLISTVFVNTTVGPLDPSVFAIPC